MPNTNAAEAMPEPAEEKEEKLVDGKADGYDNDSELKTRESLSRQVGGPRDPAYTKEDRKRVVDFHAGMTEKYNEPLTNEQYFAYLQLRDNFTKLLN